MNPPLMAVLLVGFFGAFLVSASRRARLLRAAGSTWESRTDRIWERLGSVWKFALLQKKMPYYPLAAVGHYLIFLGFLVLLLRTLVLWGRGFDPGFNLFLLGSKEPLGVVYGFLKDIFAILVLIGVGIFAYFRLIRREARMTLGVEGVVILGIIAAMMIGDLIYDGAGLVLAHRAAGCASGALSEAVCSSIAPIARPFSASGPEPEFSALEPAGSLLALGFSGLSEGTLWLLAQSGFWMHGTLVLVFLNILPRSKHFHIITAIPNVFLEDRTARGRLKPLAPSTEALMAEVEKATESPDLHGARIGYARIGHFPWKDVLDFYTCTECGRCSDNCPATQTGKLLSPKHFTLALRDYLYERQAQIVGGALARDDSASEGSQAKGGGEPQSALKPPVDLVPGVIHPDVLWACTSCRACEEQCPVSISYVDKIVQMRRNLVMIRGEFPQQLAKPFEGMESNGNPWSLSRMDRPAWSADLNLRTLSEYPKTPVLFWVGCAASYDERAKRIARNTAMLLKQAAVDFAVLGEEETCTGDPARRAGNEYLFSMLAETNAQTLNGYKERGGIRQIVTTCPHCFNTLSNEYPDFGAKFEVIHHTDFLLGLLAEGRLVPKHPVRGRVVFHDSCYLGRYNDVYRSPRRILESIEGVELVEVPHWNQQKGLCCGAGGAQMFMEEQNNNRVNVRRTLQLIETGAQTVATACPFCMTMVQDGLKSQSREQEIQSFDVVEMLALACGVNGGPPAKSASEPSLAS